MSAEEQVLLDYFTSHPDASIADDLAWLAQLQQSQFPGLNLAELHSAFTTQNAPLAAPPAGPQPATNSLPPGVATPADPNKPLFDSGEATKMSMPMKHVIGFQMWDYKPATQPVGQYSDEGTFRFRIAIRWNEWTQETRTESWVNPIEWTAKVNMYNAALRDELRYGTLATAVEQQAKSVEDALEAAVQAVYVIDAGITLADKRVAIAAALMQLSWGNQVQNYIAALKDRAKSLRSLEAACKEHAAKLAGDLKNGTGFGPRVTNVVTSMKDLKSKQYSAEEDLSVPLNDDRTGPAEAKLWEIDTFYTDADMMMWPEALRGFYDITPFPN